MIASPPPAYIAQVEMPALPPAIAIALQKRIGGVRGGVVIVLRSNGQRARVDVYPNDGAPKVDENSRFEIGTISEAITGTLLAEAARRGELQLDQPIDQIVSAGLRVPARGAHLTLRALATHRSGIPRIPLREAGQPYARYDRAALVATVGASVLDAEPGTRYAPSNVDFALLGTLLADRAGMPFDLLARNRSFTPTSMKNSTADDNGDEHLVQEYAISGEPVTPWRWNAFTPEGGIRSSALDLIRLTDELFSDENGPIAQDLQLAAMPTVGAGPDTGIGLGWLVDRGSGAVYASGYTYGTSAFIGAVPRWKEALVILSNVGIGFANGSFDDLGLRLLAERSAYPQGSMTGQ